MTLIVNGQDVDLRAGTTADVPVLFSFMRAMAGFERLPFTATEDSLREALFGESPAAETLLAFVDGRPIAYVTYFFTFATMVGRRALWLDDLFVDPAFRGKGIGRALMAYLADVAIHRDCARFEWMVLDWNERAIKFYRNLGARMLDEWRVCRMDEDQLPSVARPLVIKER
jgi:GNAT superfamily N-acetyltransferase